MALTAKQQLFVKEYLVDLNATQAAIRAGYKEKTSRAIGAENLTKPNIQAAIEEAQNKRAERTEITADMVLQRWWDIATADPGELMQLRRLNCRYCHGFDHEYQWKDEAEYQRAVQAEMLQAQQEDRQPNEISDSGGFGFDPLADPDPGCPECYGEGRPDLHLADTRKLSSKGKLLYAGLKQTQSGVEVKLQDQGKALENVARHLGMFKDSIKLEGDIGVRKLEDFM